MATIAESWSRLERGVAALGLSELRLAPGAAVAAITEFEAFANLQLPDEVRELFRGHGGQTSHLAGMAGGFHFVSLSEARKLMEDWATARAKLGEGVKDLDRACRSTPRGAIQRHYSNAGWVPFEMKTKSTSCFRAPPSCWSGWQRSGSKDAFSTTCKTGWFAMRAVV